MRVHWGRILIAMVLLVIVCGAGAVLMQPTFRDFVQTVEDVGGGAGDQPAFGEINVGGDTGDESDTTPGEAALGPATERVPGSSVGAGGAGGDLEPFKVLTLQYTPYMATLGLMAAKGYMADEGYDLQLVDVYADDVDLDEEGQCAALQAGDYHALATTIDAVRKCGEGARVGVPIGQSAGNDAIVVKPGVETWNDVFQHAVAFTGYSVSEYMACFASHTANAPMAQPVRYDDAAAAVDEWINSGAEQNIQSVVAWEPEVSRALGAVPGSRAILSSGDVRILWDVIAFSAAAMSADTDLRAYPAFTRAYYRALLDLSDDPSAALSAITEWAGDDDARGALVTTTDPAAFIADLDNEAFATLRDAAFLMEDQRTLLNRLDEAAFYWQYCGVDIPAVADPTSLVAPELVLGARSDSALLGDTDARPSGEVFQITDFTNAGAVTDDQIAQAQVIFATGVEIEFLPNRTDFRDAAAAATTLSNAVRFLRTCQECVLEVQGGAAYPGERVCPGCREEDSDQLAVDRGRRVYDELRARFDVPEAQLRFVDEPHAPQFPDSNEEAQLRQDRRTFLTGYQLAGR